VRGEQGRGVPAPWSRRDEQRENTEKSGLAGLVHGRGKREFLVTKHQTFPKNLKKMCKPKKSLKEKGD